VMSRIRGAGRPIGVRPLQILLYAGLVAATSCTDTVAPKSVASVTIAGATEAIVPGQSIHLTATPRDDAGRPLQRPVNWTSSDPTVLTVAAGLVTAVQQGNATVTAKSELMSASVTIVVDDGGLLNPAGAVVAAAGDLRIVAVEGAVSQPVPVSVKLTDRHPAGPRFFTRTAYEIQLPQVGISQPLLLTVRFDPAGLRGTAEDAIRLHVVSGDQWRRLEGNSVDTVAHTVTARMSGGGVFAPLLEAPVASVNLEPTTATVQVHEVAHFAAQLKDEEGELLTRRKVSWSSSSAAVLAVDSLTGDATGVRPGTANVIATSEGRSSSGAVHVVAGAPARLTLVTESGQSGKTNEALAAAPSVKVTDADDFPVLGVVVHFAVSQGGGTLAVTDPVTDTSGVATPGLWTLGAHAGPQQITASVGGLDLVVISAVAIAPPASIAPVEGDGQTGSTFAPASIRPAVKVIDADGLPVVGITVAFSVRSSGGSVTGESPVTDSSGVARVGSWTLGAAGENTLTAAVAELPTSQVVFHATATTQVRIVTFGDSNTDVGYAGTNPTLVAASYVSSSTLRASPNDPNSSREVAGKVESKWSAQSPLPITAVNHGISGTRTGSGRTSLEAPNARESVSGVTRFAGEVLGAGLPWAGGESGSAYSSGSILRVRAFVPGANDFVYVSMGTNDFADGLTPDQTAANLEWMVDQWVNAGRSPNHFIITTLPPRPSSGGTIPPINTLVRAIAVRRGVHLIDLAARTSDDNGATWRSSADHIGDSIHYSEVVRDWLADQIVSYLLTVPLH
jgi:lysophospholipase L1-like esterase